MTLLINPVQPQRSSAISSKNANKAHAYITLCIMYKIVGNIKFRQQRRKPFSTRGTLDIIRTQFLWRALYSYGVTAKTGGAAAPLFPKPMPVHQGYFLDFIPYSLMSLSCKTSKICCMKISQVNPSPLKQLFPYNSLHTVLCVYVIITCHTCNGAAIHQSQHNLLC